jgi:class 3 adenylate cyclase
MTTIAALPPEMRSIVAGCQVFDGVDCGDIRVGYKLFNEGEDICRFGDPGTRMWIVVSGKVAVIGERGNTVAVREPGWLVGEQALLRPTGTRTATLRATGGRVELIELAGADLPLLSNPRLALNLAQILSNKLADATEHRDTANEALAAQTVLIRQYIGEYALSQERLRPRNRSVPEHEEVLAVMWFSDLVDFSKLTAGQPPGAAARLVSLILEPQFAAIESNRGYVDKFMGDGVMALWIIDGDDPATACAAALAAAKAALAAVRAIPVGNRQCDLRIGMHLGRVVAGVFGTHDRRSYTVIGDQVNRGSRYEQMRHDVAGEPLGPIRASVEFHDSLPAHARATLPRRFIAHVKGEQFHGYTLDKVQEAA